MSIFFDFHASIKDWYEGVSKKLSFFNMKQNLTKKHKNRLTIYNTMLDFMNASANSSDISYFSWHLDQIERRSSKAPFLKRTFLGLLGKKNDQSTRDFLQYGMDRARIEEMKDIMKNFMPLDEYSLYKSDDSSDQRPIIGSLIHMCEEKIKTSEQIRAIITSNLFIILFAFGIHYIAVNDLYPAFLPADVIYGDKPDRELSALENNWYIYSWILDNWLLSIGSIGAVFIGIGVSMNKWYKRGVVLRKEFFDFLPPYSIHKITGQYQIILMIYFYLKSGKKWLDALDDVRRLSNNYIQKQVDEIILRSSSLPSHEALNTFYMGEMGDIIESRTSRDSLLTTLENTMGILEEKKAKTIENITTVLKRFLVIPLVWGSVALSLVPIALHIANMIQEAQAASNM
jgi:hypothetical protein